MEEIDSEKLIEAVEARPAIWDTRGTDYGDRVKRKQAWKEIVALFMPETASLEEMKVMEDAAQKRWKNLRDRYVKEYGRETVTGGKKKFPYRNAQLLSFLQGVVLYNRTSSPSVDRFSQKDPQEETLDIKPNIADLIMTSPVDQFRPEVPSSSKDEPPLKKKKLDPVESRIMSVLEASSARQKNDDDDDRYFLLSLLPVVKTIPDQYKLTSRIEVMEVLNKYSTLSNSESSQSLPQQQPKNTLSVDSYISDMYNNS